MDEVVRLEGHRLRVDMSESVTETEKTHHAAAKESREITVAHSPDSDDAFMFYGLATNKVRVPGLRFTHTLCDIETLNQKAREGNGFYDVTAISFHAYPYIQDNYALLPSGGSVGDGYGPMIVATQGFSPSEIKRKKLSLIHISEPTRQAEISYAVFCL